MFWARNLDAPLKGTLRERPGEGIAVRAPAGGLHHLQLPLQYTGCEPQPPSWRSGLAALPASRSVQAVASELR